MKNATKNLWCVLAALLLFASWSVAQQEYALGVIKAILYLDTTESAAPANPSAGNERLYSNSISHKISCITSSGTDCMPITGGSVPAGTIVLRLTTCPADFTEVSALNGVTVIGTLAANGNAGTTGGADTITPTVATLTAAAQTFTGSALGTHSHTGGTYNAAAQIFTGTALGTHLHGIGTYANTAASAGTPAGTNGTAAFTPAGTNNAPAIAWPAGVPTHSGTAATFAGNALTTHAHELPEQLVSNVLTRYIASATFGTGTSRAAVGQVTVTANTTAGAVALSQAVSAGTPAGTVTITNQGTIAWPAGVPTQAAPTFTGTPGTVPAETFTGSALGTHNHTFSGSSEAISAGTPAGTNGTSAVSGTSQAVSAGTPAGTNGTSAVSGTLNSFDNRSAFVRVIFCSKN